VVSTVRAHEIRTEDKLKLEDVPTYINPGASVECKVEGWIKYYPGVIKSVNLETLQCAVLFEDGELRTDVRISQIRMARKPSKNAVQFADDVPTDKVLKFRVGDRVMANPDGEWSRAYPGRVERLLPSSTSYAILFDDGDRKISREADMTLMATAPPRAKGPGAETDNRYGVGSQVEAKVGGWRNYYSGVVEACHDDGTFRVRFVDGEAVDKVLAAEMRQSRLAVSEPPKSPRGALYAVGDKVECRMPHWQDQYWGTVSRVNPNGTYKIDFDDGEQWASVAPDFIVNKR